MQDAEDRRRRFQAMLQSVERETDRDGAVSVDEVLAEMDAIIDAAEK
jgi:antitoxin ParD1/3/4